MSQTPFLVNDFGVPSALHSLSTPSDSAVSRELIVTLSQLKLHSYQSHSNASTPCCKPSPN